MTAQRPEEFENPHPNFSVGDQFLYGVLVGADWESAKVFEPRLPAEEPVVECTALWRGHVRHYTLHADGRLELRRYSYPFSDEDDREMSETLEGDFWLVFRPYFFGPDTRVPFVDGSVVLDKEKWHVEEAKYGPGGFFDPL